MLSLGLHHLDITYCRYYVFCHITSILLPNNSYELPTPLSKLLNATKVEIVSFLAQQYLLDITAIYFKMKLEKRTCLAKQEGNMLCELISVDKCLNGAFLLVFI